MLLLRSTLFYAWMFGTLPFYALAVLLLAPFPYRWRYAIARGWTAAVLGALRVLCGLRYQVEGTEHIPAEPSVVMLKHSSTFETLAELHMFPTQCWVLKRELMWIPFFGWGAALLKPIAIDRSAGRSAVRQVIDQGRRRLAEGIWVMVFPEGTRMPPGQTRRYGVSGAALASEAGCPVVPVAHNAGDFWPRRGWLKRPGTVRFCIGPPVRAAGREPRDINGEVQAWIEAKVREISVR